MKVLFSRYRNDFEHVYDLSAVPLIGHQVGLLRQPHHSAADWFWVAAVQWTPDHTKYDVVAMLVPIHPASFIDFTEGPHWTQNDVMTYPPHRR